jgi:hypothetical protein
MLKLCCVFAAALSVTLGAAPVLASEWSESIDVGADGWTVLTPSVDSRIIYVSSSGGNDHNSGLSESEPKRSLAAGYELLRHGHPDWLLLKSGDTWYESFPQWTRSGRSPGERMVVRAYGSGPRPRLMTGSNTAVYLNPGGSAHTRNLAFMDLHLNAHDNPGTAAATGFMLFNGVHNVLIENCYVENYRVNMIFQAFADGIRASNIAVRRSVIADALATNSAHAQGIYADGVDGLLIEECVFDMNGWSPSVPTANIFRHNIYIQTTVGGDRGCSNVITRGNITARASASGFMMRTGGVSEDNLFLQNPIGLQFGQTSGPASSGVVRNNVFLDSRDISPTVNRGMGLNVSYAQGVEVTGNIIAHQRSGTKNVQAIGVDGTYRNLTIRNNVVYDWRDPGSHTGRALGFFGTALSNISVLDNHFQMPHGGFLVGHWGTAGPAFTFAGNRYYSSNGGEHQFFSWMTYEQWLNQSGETGAQWGQTAFPQPRRDIAGYMASMNRPASLDEFMTEARKQARNYWRPEFTAAGANQWIRQGFGMGNPACKADLNGDGLVNIHDAMQLMAFMSAGDPRADINEDGKLNVEDYSSFVALMTRGCD